MSSNNTSTVSIGGIAVSPVDHTDALIGLSVTVGLLLILVAIFVCFILLRLFRHGKSATSGYTSGAPSWHISAKDIKFFSCESRNTSGTQISDSTSICSQSLLFTSDNGKESSGKPCRTEFGFFSGQPICLKKYLLCEVSIDKSVEREFELLANMHHENLAAFFGVCMRTDEMLLVTEYCIKGSLEEILLFEPVHLDEQFIASLIIDIVKGMTYLHKMSSIHVHGNLKSSNCLVTGRWVVKLSDFGLTSIRSASRVDRDYLWSAPEVIKMKELSSQKSDIYSFGIVLYELVGKQGPFGKSYSYSDEDVRALICRICENGYHPETSWLCCEDYLKNIMLSCWQPLAKMRPDFHVLYRQLKPLRAILNGRSIVDNMLIMMERYQMRLEDLVEEKTSQLTREKKKTENLLHRMLPPQVADQLLSGRPVIPESFSCITVFFSDICDFTCIASSTTPIQVIQLLNNLYTAFDSIIKNYDVYKVETVGDAYFCVSGLPRPNGDNHAVEICLMALDMVKVLKSFVVENSETGDQKQLQIRIGIHSGPCVAGVVGVSMPRYTLFGDTINVASRLETSGEPMKIHISKQTKDLLDKTGGFTCHKRGTVNLKGKGDMVTWWLDGTKAQFTRECSKELLLTSAFSSLCVPTQDSCSSSSRHSSFTSDMGLDYLQVTSPSRTRSNSLRSNKSTQIFNRYLSRSFRQKIKNEKLCSPHVSEENMTSAHSGSKKPTTAGGNHEESVSLLRQRSAEACAALSAGIRIQVDHAD